ncbi:hypothetical protein ACIQ6Y_32180 [Streptomyces sp. NPDC096205]|uniref:hypothetical protein n=1 Tax=Streptomyces sp. NPDC096205 TaxID=3366081 RepID=UPI0037F6F38B
MRKLLMVMVVALMAAIGFAAPAQAAPVSMPYGFAYGNSTATGTINFSDGYTASVSGVVHAASGRRQVCATGFNGDVVSDPPVLCSPWAYAGGQNPSWGGPLQIARPGGVLEVYILMYDENDTRLAGVVCTRRGCSRLQI